MATDRIPTSNDPWPGWGVYRGRNEPDDRPSASPVTLPDPPPWRRFPRDQGATVPAAGAPDARAATYRSDRTTVEMVNAALYLRRPLLVTGKPGSGKSTLPYAVARELRLGRVLRWNITSKTTLKDGLYRYDALARLHDYNMGRDRPVAEYIDLGPLGTALLPSATGTPRVLLIDEIDKADIDLPNDLLNVFEEGYFDIPELAREQYRAETTENAVPAKAQVRSADGDIVEVSPGRIHCTEFPFVVLTSNDERDFPAPFLRRCLRLYLSTADDKLLARIVEAHLPIDGSDPKSSEWKAERARLIADFMRRARKGDLATDQLLNAVFMTVGAGAAVDVAGEGQEVKDRRQRLVEALLHHLTPVSASDQASVSGESALGTDATQAEADERPVRS